MEKKDIRLMIEDVKFSARAVGVLKKNNKIWIIRWKVWVDEILPPFKLY